MPGVSLRDTLEDWSSHYREGCTHWALQSYEADRMSMAFRQRDHWRGPLEDT